MPGPWAHELAAPTATGTTSPHQRGITGERLTAKALTSLPASWTCLHSRSLGSRADVDHAVIGPQGVFAVDSKNLHHCHRYGDALWSNAGRLDLEPTRYGASQLERQLGVPVTPVACLVGQRLSGTIRDLWIVGLHDLVNRLTSGPGTYPPEVVDAFVAVIRRCFPPARWTVRHTSSGRFSILDADRRVIGKWSRNLGLRVTDERQRDDLELFVNRRFGHQGELPLA